MKFQDLPEDAKQAAYQAMASLITVPRSGSVMCNKPPITHKELGRQIAEGFLELYQFDNAPEEQKKTVNGVEDTDRLGVWDKTKS
ncbi:hypothetical protein [Buttiauxella sp. S19-1]|uniref:hypothetical protein n=1 Tax=Buttiauxella sp. S19-1 TaxID=941430 RepID=UPI001EDBFDD0|nr:hypothetical protein [Buttiauxella sp. S19-1]